VLTKCSEEYTTLLGMSYTVRRWLDIMVKIEGSSQWSYCIGALSSSSGFHLGKPSGVPPAFQEDCTRPILIYSPIVAHNCLSCVWSQNARGTNQYVRRTQSFCISSVFENMHSSGNILAAYIIQYYISLFPDIGSSSSHIIYVKVSRYDSASMSVA
jgi:hypothetical protein